MPTAFVFDGAAATLRTCRRPPRSAARTRHSPTSGAASPFRLVRRVGVMHYVVEQVSAAAAAAAAARLSLAPPEALDGLSPEEIARHPELRAAGRRREHGRTAAGAHRRGQRPRPRQRRDDGRAGASMKFKSLQPLFGRTWELYCRCGRQRSRLKGRVDDDYRRPVPIAPFTLHAKHPGTYVQIDQAGDFTGTFTGNLASTLGRVTASSSYYDVLRAAERDRCRPQLLLVEHRVDCVWGECSVVRRQLPGRRHRLARHDEYLVCDTVHIELFDAAGQVVASADNVDVGTTGSADVVLAADGRPSRSDYGPGRLQLDGDLRSQDLRVGELVGGRGAAGRGLCQHRHGGRDGAPVQRRVGHDRFGQPSRQRVHREHVGGRRRVGRRALYRSRRRLLRIDRKQRRVDRIRRPSR